MTRRLHAAGWFVCLLVVITISACGSDDKPATPSVTGPAGPTVGQLADQIASAWPSVTSMRTVSQGLGGITPGSVAAGTPNAAPALKVVSEVVIPDRKHQVSTLNGDVQEELVLIDGKLYVRGPQTSGIPATTISGEWRVVDAATISPQSTPASQIASFVAPVQPLYAGLSADKRDRAAKPLGTITVDGRSCQAYQIVDTTNTGERIDVILAVDADNLPCSIETKTGGIDYLTTFAFNIPITITPPVESATPAST